VSPRPLRAKKYDETHGIWQARVTRGWRFYVTIDGDVYRLLAECSREGEWEGQIRYLPL